MDTESLQNPDVLFYPREGVERAVSSFETPFFLYSEERIRANCRRFRNAFRKHFPDFDPLFAVKANPNPTLLQIIMDEGFGLDCSSESEVWLTGKLGGRGMYTGNYTTEREFRAAKKVGLILNLDDITALPIVQEIGVPDTLSFRINPGQGNGSMESLVLAGPDAKFGVPRQEVKEAYKKAAEAGVKHFGMHMMTGSNVLREEYFSDVVRKLFEIIREVRQRIEFINMGGGFGVPYRPEERSLDITEVARQIRAVFDENQTGESPEPKLMAEPGRYIAADAGWLVTKVTCVKRAAAKTFVGVDAACNDMPRPSIYGAYHHVSVLNDWGEQEVASVVGGICENNDQFARDRLLPMCKQDDVIIIHNVGAHGYAMGHNYNGRPRHAEYLLRQDGTIGKIRDAESVEDLFRGTNL